MVLEVETPDDLALAEDTNGTNPFQGQVQSSTLAPETGGIAYESRNATPAVFTLPVTLPATRLDCG